MRQVANGKRSRGRPGRNKPSNPRNHTFDSNGPEGRVRGSANQVFEKYLSMARDAQSSGDRIMAENLFQHAEHYFRIVNANAAQNGGQNGNGQPQGRNRPYGNTSDEFEESSSSQPESEAADPASQPQPTLKEPALKDSAPKDSAPKEPPRKESAQKEPVQKEPTSPAELAAAAAGNRAGDAAEEKGSSSTGASTPGSAEGRPRRGRRPRAAQDNDTSDSTAA